LLLLAIIYGIYQLRYQWIIRTNSKLEKEVKLHVAQHKLLIEELKESIKELEISRERLIKANNEKEKLISILVHDLSTPLKFLNKLSTRLHTQFDNLEAPDKMELIREINASSTEIFIFSDNFLKWLHPSRLKLQSVIQPFEIKIVLDELYNDYNNISGFRNNTIDLDLDRNSTVTTDRFAVKIIMRNLMVIANSYIDNSHISIRFNTTPASSIFTVNFPASAALQDSIEKIYLLKDDLEGLQIGEYPLFINFSIIKSLVSKIGGNLQVVHSANGTISLSVVFPNLVVTDLPLTDNLN